MRSWREATYEGRTDADLTGWLAYFIPVWARSSGEWPTRYAPRPKAPTLPEVPELQRLDRQARVVSLAAE